MTSARSRLTPLDDAVAYRINRLARLLRHGFAAELQAWSGEELTPEQYFALYRLRQAGPLPMQALADPVLKDYPNITRVVAGLQKRGLVKRSKDKADGRVQLCTLTGKGEALFDRLYPSVVAERGRLFADWSARDLSQLMSSLSRLERTLEQQSDVAAV
jgi:MarR family transcriptional regulator, organic hydroperoxide resistance regulator